MYLGEVTWAPSEMARCVFIATLVETNWHNEYIKKVLNHLNYPEATHGWLPLVVEIYLANRGQSVATVNKSFRPHLCLVTAKTLLYGKIFSLNRILLPLGSSFLAKSFIFI